MRRKTLLFDFNSQFKFINKLIPPSIRALRNNLINSCNQRTPVSVELPHSLIDNEAIINSEIQFNVGEETFQFFITAESHESHHLFSRLAAVTCREFFLVDASNLQSVPIHSDAREIFSWNFCFL